MVNSVNKPDNEQVMTSRDHQDLKYCLLLMWQYIPTSEYTDEGLGGPCREGEGKRCFCKTLTTDACNDAANPRYQIDILHLDQGLLFLGGQFEPSPAYGLRLFFPFLGNEHMLNLRVDRCICTKGESNLGHYVTPSLWLLFQFCPYTIPT